MTTTTTTTTSSVVAGFLSLPLPDQMNLLQSTWLDIICFNEAFRSTPYEGSIVFADDFKCSETESKKFGIPSSLDFVTRKLAQKMTKMMVTTEEYILLKTILLLNPGKLSLWHHMFFTAVAPFSHRSSVRPFVHPSVCLSICSSHGWISQKRCKL